MPVAVRDVFRLTPIFWWPVLVLSLVRFRAEIARALAAGHTHGEAWLFPRGELVLVLAERLPAPPPRPAWQRAITDARAILARCVPAPAMAPETAPQRVLRRVWPTAPSAAAAAPLHLPAPDTS